MYVISVAGIPGALVTLGGTENAKRSIQDQTTLTARGKPALHPNAVEFVPAGDTADVLLAFPKTSPFTPADQEIDFASRIGTVAGPAPCRRHAPDKSRACRSSPVSCPTWWTWIAHRWARSHAWSLRADRRDRSLSRRHRRGRAAHRAE